MNPEVPRLQTGPSGPYLSPWVVFGIAPRIDFLWETYSGIGLRDLSEGGQLLGGGAKLLRTENQSCRECKKRGTSSRGFLKFVRVGSVGAKYT